MREVVSRTPASTPDTKIQGCSIKSHRTMHTIGLPHWQIPNCRSKTLFTIHTWLNPQMWDREYRGLTIEKNLRVVDLRSSNLCFSRINCASAKYNIYFLLVRSFNWQLNMSLIVWIFKFSFSTKHFKISGPSGGKNNKRNSSGMTFENHFLKQLFYSFSPFLKCQL